jgi:hypothetical protein
MVRTILRTQNGERMINAMIKKTNLADALAPSATGYGEDLQHHSEAAC